ncbi:MAG: hypothetical protein OXP73_09930 [Chloroflexota bacterium]|nr:hypothetical protein [Chloroflexota bacterium]
MATIDDLVTTNIENAIAHQFKARRQHLGTHTAILQKDELRERLLPLQFQVGNLTKALAQNSKTAASGQLTNANLSRNTGKLAEAIAEHDHYAERVRHHEVQLKACWAELERILD